MSMQRTFHHQRATIMCSIAAVLFAFNGVAVRLLLDAGLSATRLTQIRSFGALLCFAAIVLIRNPKSLRISKADIPFLMVYGIAGFAFVQFFYFIAIKQLGVGIGLLFEFTAPVWILLWVRFIRKEHVRRRMFGAVAFTVTGLILISQMWSSARMNVVGIVCGFIASGSLAIYFMLGEKGVQKRDTQSLIVWGFIFANLFWTITQPIWSYPTEYISKNYDIGGPFAGTLSGGIWVIIYVVILGTVVPFYLTVSALKYTTPARVGIIGTLEPIFAGAIAWWWMGESLNAIQLVGSAVVIAGILLAETARS